MLSEMADVKREPLPRKERARQTRLRMTRAAYQLFTERGYTATTMADIGAAVGIRGPSLYKHVASKHELLAEIMIGTMEQLIADNILAKHDERYMPPQLGNQAAEHAVAKTVEK